MKQIKPLIENNRYWDLPTESLRFIARDAKEAMDLNPMCPTALKWADQINDACSVMYWRTNNCAS